jgi:glucose/arabinose dehydrogenase
MEFAPDGRLFVNEQGGKLRVIKSGALLPTPFVDLSTTTDSAGERGFLGIAFDPNFTSNHYVYVYHTVKGSPPHNRVSRFTANGDLAVSGSEVAILDLDNLSSSTDHNGGAIHFGKGGRLLVNVGNNANNVNSQSISNRHGKILRINANGTIPIDNPTSFPGIGGKTSGANRAIWAVGFRNPFRQA